MFRVWSPWPSIAPLPLADFTPSPNTRLMGLFGKGHCRNLSENFREVSADFCRISRLFPDAIKRTFQTLGEAKLGFKTGGFLTFVRERSISFRENPAKTGDESRSLFGGP